ncbi:MAG: hypothetical protein JWM57_419 [Phycisphaerales bacterium]|nr:hypothetical protein [Phycisphaerales bacterium]
MTWLTPIWLCLLLPWAAAWLWIGRASGPTAGVPFLHLWPASQSVGGPRHRRPPVWIVLLMAAVLAMILGAAGPAVRRATPHLTVILDRSPAMAGERLKAALSRLPITATTGVRVLPVPGEPVEIIGPIDPTRWPATALPTIGLLEQAIRREPGPAIVLTGQSPSLPPGFVRVTAGPWSNAGIDRFAITPFAIARSSTQPNAAAGQAMVTVLNDTDRVRAILRVDGVRQPIDLPPVGQSQDYFVDLPALGDTCEAELLAEGGKPWADDVTADNHAYLARTAVPARIEARTAVSDDLSRMIAVYQHRRPAGPDAPVVVIAKGEAQATPAVILAGSLVPASDTRIEIHSSVDASHPITRSAMFDGVDFAGYPTAGPPGEGWRTLIYPNAEPILNNVSPLLAVRELPVRQVWVGFDTGVLAGRADYVIFWTDVFDWLSGGPPAYTAEPARTGLTPVVQADAAIEASPGLYHDADKTIATAGPAYRSAPPVAPGPGALAALATVADPIAAWPLGAGLVLITAGLLMGRRLTGF